MMHAACSISGQRSRRERAEKLWDDEEKDNYLRNIRSEVSKRSSPPTTKNITLAKMKTNSSVVATKVFGRPHIAEGDLNVDYLSAHQFVVAVWSSPPLQPNRRHSAQHKSTLHCFRSEFIIIFYLEGDGRVSVRAITKIWTRARLFIVTLILPLNVERDFVDSLCKEIEILWILYGSSVSKVCHSLW